MSWRQKVTYLDGIRREQYVLIKSIVEIIQPVALFATAVMHEEDNEKVLLEMQTTPQMEGEEPITVELQVAYLKNIHTMWAQITQMLND